MKNRYLRISYIFLLIGTTIVSFQNCSGTNGLSLNRNLTQLSSNVRVPFVTRAKSNELLLNYCADGRAPVLNGISVSAVGSPEQVWLAPSSNDVNGPIADAAISAYRDSQGKVSLVIPHINAYRLTGDSLNNINPNSLELIFKSDKNTRESDHNYAHWLFAPYSNDGVNFIGINHHEWYACLVNNDCNDNQQTIYASWFNSLTKIVSNNGGKSWSVPADHLIVAPPLWNKQPYLNKPQNNRGFFHPSRLVKEGNFYYLIAASNTSPDDVSPSQAYSGMIILRSSDFTNWEVWTGGSNYSTVGSVKPATIPGVDTVLVSLTYNSSLCAYMMVYTTGMIGRGAQAVKYRLTASMANPQWTEEREITGTRQTNILNNIFSSGFIVNNYPSLIDDSSGGYNFEFTGSSPFLYYSTFGSNAFVRDIYRLRLKIEGTGVTPTPERTPTSVSLPTPTPTPAPVTPPQITKAQIIGNIDSVTNTSIGGWACEKSIAKSISVHLYLGGPAGRGSFSGSFTANQTSEASVLSSCGVSSGAYRFTIDLPPSFATAYAGQLIYIHGISTTGGENLAINGSGVLSLPGLKMATPAPTPTPTPAPQPAPTPEPIPTPKPLNTKIIGFIDVLQGNTSVTIGGWACEKTIAKSITVHLYLGGPAGSGTFIGGYSANQSSEPGVASSCGVSSGAYRFSITLPQSVAAQYAGKSIYIHGISTTGGANLMIDRSGQLYLPQQAIESQPPISEGLFMIGAAIYYSNGSHYCYYPNMTVFTQLTGRTSGDGIRQYPSIPSSMQLDGNCGGQ